jgi:hypothetical protein
LGSNGDSVGTVRLSRVLGKYINYDYYATEQVVSLS